MNLIPLTPKTCPCGATIPTVTRSGLPSRPMKTESRCIECNRPIGRGRQRCGECNAAYVQQFTGRKPFEPTEEQIAETAAAIRAGWSEQDLARRAGLVEREVEAEVVSLRCFAGR